MTSDRCELLCLDLPRAENLRHRRIEKGDAVVAAGVMGALAEPTRLTIACALRDGGELCVCDLSWIVERSQALVSHHLRVLREAGLAEMRRDGRMALYSLTARAGELLAIAAPEISRA
jgi:ArsR family transcriptional regulator, lead/cadmium/zinc/bismuth-responsive transcriptional repressor